MKLKTLQGLTLMEIIVATVIFAVAVSGLVNLFVAGKKYILHSRSRMSGGELGKVFLDPLQMSVAQNTWDTVTNSLKAGSYYCDDTSAGHTGALLPNCAPANQRILDGTPYNADYTVQDMSGESNNPELRRVVLTVNWSENQP